MCTAGTGPPKTIIIDSGQIATSVAFHASVSLRTCLKVDLMWCAPAPWNCPNRGFACASFCHQIFRRCVCETYRLSAPRVRHNRSCAVWPVLVEMQCSELDSCKNAECSYRKGDTHSQLFHRPLPHCHCPFPLLWRGMHCMLTIRCTSGSLPVSPSLLSLLNQTDQ